MKSRKGKAIQKISLFAALVALICMALAVSVMADTTEGVKGDVCYIYGDVDEDGSLTEDDAIYLLYHSVFGAEEYPIEYYECDEEIIAKNAIELLAEVGTNTIVHAYGEPVWQWTTDGTNASAKAIYSCACGKTDQVEVVAGSVEVVTKEATCTDAGSITYKAKAEHDGVTYDSVKVVQTGEATGYHTYASSITCSDRQCENCDYVDKASAHVYEAVGKTKATCTKAATISYECKVCHESEYTVEDGIAAGHSYEVEDVQLSTCEWKEVYDCKDCDSVVDGEHYYKHVETAEITKEATCSHDGTKLYTCSKCDATHEEEILSVADAHVWNDGTTVGTLITYECKEASCTATRTAINAVEEKVAEVNSTVLAETKEIDLNGTSLKLDDATAEQLTGNVEIKAEEKKATELALTPEQKQQIGDNPVYDFSIKDDNGAVENFDGSITISLPYELQPGDDADCIDVWYIADDGKVTIEQGTYANGYVTFTATHFSYYTVTRLTPEQRCEKYGHNDATNVIAATCTEGGYTIKVCARCGRTEKSDATEALGHKLVTTGSAATCTTAGKETVTCENCDYKKTTQIPATGHEWNETTEKATCAEAKKVSVGCKNCDDTKEIILAQLQHDTETVKVNATCETKGYELTTCKNCDYENKVDTDPAKIHSYEVSWTWAEDMKSAVATLKCKNEGCDKSVDRNATVEITKQLAVSCEEDGYIDYLATASYNGKTYTDEETVVLKATGHNTTEEWQYNSLKHYHECSLCNGKLEEADHIMGDGVVTKKVTCTEAGEIVYSCSVCDYLLVEAVPAPGHNYDNGICTECGYGTALCTHEELYLIVEEFTEEDGYCGGEISYMTCDCGKVKEFWGYDFNCDFEYETDVQTDENGYAKHEITATCEKCGLHFVEEDSWEMQDACVGTLNMDMIIFDKNNEVIFQFEGVYEEDIEHPANVYGKKDDLTQYGLCGGSVTPVECSCGQQEMLMFDFKCNWKTVEDECGEGKYVAICEECGIKMVNVYDATELGNCRAEYTENYAFYNGTTKLVEYEYSEEIEIHENDVRFELDGTTCQDGYTIYETCKVCGNEESRYQKMPEGMHITYYMTMDVSEYDLCVDTIDYYSCPCGEESNVMDVYYNHSFETIKWDETEEGNNYTVYGKETCVDCGFTMEYTNIITNTGNGCEYHYDYSCAYSVEDKVILTEKQEYTDTMHEFEVIDYKLLGDTCKDGVEITYECSVCGVVEESTTYYHEQFVKESYNAEDYGLCAGIIEVVGCACGEYGWINENNKCDWNWYAYDPETDTTTFACELCGKQQDVRTITKELEGCQVERTQIYEYIDGTSVVLSVDRTYLGYEHDNTYTFDIEEGATCSDGFIVNTVCKDCGATSSWQNSTPEGEHAHYRTEIYDMSEYGFCDGFVYKWACPCGEESGIGWDESNCKWDWLGVDENGNAIVECITCGLTRYMDSKLISENGCEETYQVTYFLADANDEVKLEISSKQIRTNHEFDITFEIETGASCSDGYAVIRTCKECGYSHTENVQSGNDEHETYLMGTYNLVDYGFCGGSINIWECPCGEEKHANWDVFEYCDFEWVEDAETGEECRECTVCGGYILSLYDWVIVDDCHDYETEEYKVYAPDGTLVTEFESIWRYENHTDICTFDVTNGNCESGYTVTMTCQVCGEVRQHTGYEHELYSIKMTDLAELGFCGGTITDMSCACGQETSAWSYQDCSWNQTEYNYNDETGERNATYECSVCKNIKKEYSVVSDKDSNCMAYITYHYELCKADGTSVAEWSNTNTTREHNWIMSFVMQGDSCEDGYYVVRTCQDCGESYQETYLYTEHMNWTVESMDLKDVGLCGGTAYHYRCACKQNDHWNINGEACSWYWQEMSSGATCTKCGTVRTFTSEESVIDACHTQIKYSYTYIKDGSVIWSYTENSIRENHDVVYTLALMNSGTTCMNGYTATGTCSKCNETMNVTGYDHITFVVDKEDLSDDGLCAGTVVTRYACACGENGYIIDQEMTSGCRWSHDPDSSSADVEIYTCSICGATKEVTEVITEKDVNCYAKAESLNKYFDKDGNQVFEIEWSHMTYDHDYQMTGEVEMDDPSDCEAGFYVLFECRDCGEIHRERWYGHMAAIQQKYDLTEYGACEGAYVEVHACNCGKQQNVSYYFENCTTEYTWNEYYDNDGVRHTVVVIRCQECDLMYKEDRVLERDLENCMETEITTVTIQVGDVAVAEPFAVITTYEQHEIITTATLAEGATNCEDGVVIKDACQYCDYSSTYGTTGHVGVEIARYDASDYGSVCGGYIVKEGCPCGEYSYIGFDGVDCDLDYTNKLYEQEYENQYTTEGNRSYYRDETLIKCAVTNPTACGFSVYETVYNVWDQEKCEMITYKSWKLGYNDVAGTWADEIIVETDRNAYHTYEASVNGDTTTETCTYCGSTHVITYVEDADGYVTKNEESATNTLDNGEAKYRCRSYEYVIYKGYSYETKYYNDVTYANGNTWWIHYDYEYDWENFDCTAVRTMTDSYGNTEVYDVESHKGYWSSVTLEDATCTQYGKGQYQKDCPVCEQHVTQEPHDIYPNGHVWGWYEETGIYVCWNCGLENVNGADGDIIFEDMSNDTEYVIGYHKETNVSFAYELLVILGEYEIPLTDITYTELTRAEDGINAISFNKSDAETAAVEALEAEGCADTTGFALRFVFIPESSDGDFDYAITLTDESITE